MTAVYLMAAERKDRRLYDYIQGQYMENAIGPALDGSEAVLDHSNLSCGVSALWGLTKTPKELVDIVLYDRNKGYGYKNYKEAFVVFSDKTSSSRGQDLADYIRQNNLGAIIESEERVNPNTGNIIKVWVWSPPHQSLDPRDKYVFTRPSSTEAKKDERFESEKTFQERG